MHVFYVPIYIYWIFLGIRTGRLFFFSAANPGMVNGGIINDPKYPILKQIPGYIPVTCRRSEPHAMEGLEETLKEKGLSFPLIAKPDIGERGVGVSLLETIRELKEYLDTSKGTILLQEFCDLPREAGIFYYRMPGSPKGTISSIVVRDFMQVTGDGKSTLYQLLKQKKRNRLYLHKIDKNQYDRVLGQGEKLLIEPIGNHNRGTTFLDGRQHITLKLINTIDKLSQQIDGFFYGRYDIKFDTWEKLEQGKDFKVLEVNGAKSEPAHIYHPGKSIFSAYRDIFWHWNIMNRIARINHKESGAPYLTFFEGASEIKKFLLN